MMLLRRERLVRFLDRSGAIGRLLDLRQRVPLPFLTVVTYHRVSALTDRRCAVDDGVVDATPSQLERQVQMLARHFTLLDTRQLARCIRTRRFPRNAALITFDDGYRDCVDTVLPILKSHGARATFFISTSHVEDRRLFWWDRISCAIKRSGERRIRIDYPFPLTIDLSRPEIAIRALQSILKNLHGVDVERFLDTVTRRAGVAWDRSIERRWADDLIMSWDDVRRLRDAGMDIQSHTRTHRPLHTLPTDQLERELRGSRHDIERQLDEPVHAIAYPVGRSISHRTDLRAAVRACGYTLGFSNASGVNRRLHGIDPLDIHRIAADRDTSDAMFRASIALPSLAYVSAHNA